MRACYLHIGMPKTGTMSIQASLGQARRLAGAKYIVLDKQTNCSAPLLEIFGGEVPVRFRDVRQGWSAGQVQAEKDRLLGLLRAGFADANQKTFVLSGERLHNLSTTQLKALHNELASHVDEVRVVAYVRGAASWIESAFQQRVKTGDPADFNNLRKVLPDYRAKFERFDLAFGRDKVTLWPFVSADFPGKDVVLDFCKRLGIPFEKSQVIIDNEGVSVDGVGLLYLYRRLGKPEKLTLKDKQDIRLLTRHLRELEGDKMYIGEVVLRPYLADMAPDMAWMEGRFGGTVSTPPTPRPGSVTSEAQLLQPTPKAVTWLEAQLGRPLPAQPTAQQVADGMNEYLAQLLQQAADKRAAGQANKVVKAGKASKVAEKAKRLAKAAARKAIPTAG